MKRGLTAALLLSLAMVPATAQARDRDHRGGVGMSGLNANPTSLIAAEIALSQLARDKGQWKAMRDTAAPDAELLAPDPVDAEDWLKHRQPPPATRKWEPQTVWMSCDGSIGVVEGSWSQGKATGRFASVWQRQKKGDYKWLLRQDIAGKAPPAAASDMLSAIVAECPPRPAKPAGQERERSREVVVARADPLAGSSKDGTLTWRSGGNQSDAHRLVVQIRKNGSMETVLGAGPGIQPDG